MAMDSLTDTQKETLDLEAQWFATTGCKETAIRGMGLTPVRYYQLLNRLIDSEAALVHNPAVVNRLLRLRVKDSGHNVGRGLS